MEEFFSNQETDQTSGKMQEIFDALIEDSSSLNNLRASSDLEGTKELAIVKLIDSEDTTQEILSALRDTDYGEKIQELFPKRNLIQTIVQRREKNSSFSKRLILLNGLDESQNSDGSKKFVLFMLDKEHELPFTILGEQELSLSGEDKEKCQKVINLQKANLQYITDKLVKNSF